MDIMDMVPRLSEGRVAVGPGTLYNLLEQFADCGMIRETKTLGRKRSYIITDAGRLALEKEYERLKKQAEDYLSVMGKEFK